MLSDAGRKLLADIIKANEHAVCNNYFLITIPKNCKGYELQIGLGNANAHMTVKLPLIYTYQSAQTYKKRNPGNPDNSGFA